MVRDFYYSSGIFITVQGFLLQFRASRNEKTVLGAVPEGEWILELDFHFEMGGTPTKPQTQDAKRTAAFIRRRSVALMP